MTETAPPSTQYSYSLRHDRALNLCISEHGACPHGCAKDGAPNCAWHVGRLDCEPARMAVVP